MSNESVLTEDRAIDALEGGSDRSAPVEFSGLQEAVSSAETTDGNTAKAVAVVSGGMDSVAMLYKLYQEETKDILVVSFDYGQRHGQSEIPFANMHARVLGLNHVVVGLAHIGQMFAALGSESSLINEGVAVPDGHYAEESMKATVVPNRNMIMASIAAGLAVSVKANIIGLGVHGGDHFIYPDCRPSFFHDLEEAVQRGNEGFGHAEPIKFFTPWMYVSKTDIVRWAYDTPNTAYSLKGERHVDLRFTWSCYKGDTTHCGTCGTCTERKEAFSDAGVDDPTIYADAPVQPVEPGSQGYL
jgi:7-cyano-7-deazaguanine synthase